jgi:hypothetical protein
VGDGLELPASFRWDQRSARHRAPAYAYHEVVLSLHGAGIEYTDEARAYTELSAGLALHIEPRPFQKEDISAFRKAGVHMILTGHLHVSFSEDVAVRDAEHRLISVHAGTCISSRTRGEPNSYNRITVDGDEVTVMVRAWNGSRFVDGNHKTYRRGSRTPELEKVPAHEVRP